MFFPLVLFGAVVLMFVTIGPLHRRFGKAKAAGLGMIVGTGAGHGALHAADCGVSGPRPAA